MRTAPDRSCSRAGHPTSRSMLVKRHPDYWEDGLPYVDGVTIRIIPDENSVLAALDTGDVHHYVLEDNKNYADAGDPRARCSSRRFRRSAPTSSTSTTANRSWPISAVRQALSMAMNREEILQIAGVRRRRRLRADPADARALLGADDRPRVLPAGRRRGEGAPGRGRLSPTGSTWTSSTSRPTR